jgi:long-chain-fatty-acid--[acyl-carrier-protein] ligase
MKRLLNIFVMAMLWFRYRVTVVGLRDIQPDGRPIFFLPNHPALIDPVIVMTRLYQRFQPRPLADEAQVSRMVIRRIAGFMRTIIIPDLAGGGRKNRDRVEDGLQQVVNGLKQGDNVLLYPAGRLMRSNREDLGANSAVYQIISKVENVRVVLLRTTGLWGSSFSRANGAPSLLQGLRKHIQHLLAGGIFFMPRRSIEIEVREAVDFPVHGDKMTMNRFLESFYNAAKQPLVLVPYFRGQGKAYEVEEPEHVRQVRDTSAIPFAVRELVLKKICDLAGVDQVQEDDHLASDLAMDSLVLVEFGVFLGEEFGVPSEHLDGLQTVANCILAAGGILPDAPSFTLDPVCPAWFAGEKDDKKSKCLKFPQGNTVADLFLAQAERHPNQVIVADQISGEKTYRQLIVAVFTLLPQIRKIPGPRVGIMMPATVSAVITYLAVMFAGREPVMVNWTTGIGQMDYCLRNCGVSHVITAKAFMGRLGNQGIGLADVEVEWVYLEELAKSVSLTAKGLAFLKSRCSLRSLRRAKIAETAAILFTSGSEAHPKSVPLSHENFLTNGRDVSRVLSLETGDRLLGILPVFHSLGLAGTVILPLCTGMRTVYWPNPTEGRQLAKLIASYRVTTLITTPTFLQNILHQADEEELISMRLVFSGAEKCPEALFDRLADQAPGAVLCEGYGVTECSPVISVNRPESPVPGSIGYLLPSMQAVLLHPENGKPVGYDQPGRLLVRGPNVFSGYLGDAPTPFVTHDGQDWYDTGDLVIRRPDGLITFAGRLKRFVKLGGEMISLPAIEEILQRSFSVEHEEPTLAVVATGDEQPELLLLTVIDISRQQVNKVLHAGGLSPLHNIRRVQQVGEIPLLGTGKIDYRSAQKGIVTCRDD